ncbi:antibiotic biosynthesis monooxygenase [Pleurocapsa sp. PCC 7319]|uniref:antibiotic biosynthesis monooxygenase family protein n=1 Tax=Pleurocapsa sp. PCC 7319 TaxID=118161 RepID=UPI000372F03B|nr:antibiotic biosynthesis monooxygenase [Pleurocapsa sp. PCC 7319]
MIVRIFRVSVPPNLHAEFEKDFLAISVPYVEKYSGLVSIVVGRPAKPQSEEYVMVSTWKDEASVKAFAGHQWSEAVIPTGMKKYVKECWVHHYEVFENPID